MTTVRDHQYSNETLDGIESDAVRYIWAGYLLFVLASSLIGDTIDLIASYKYQAIKLHGVIVVIIQHIAICDLMVSVTEILPALISVANGKWVLGTFLCYLTPHAKYYLNAASICLICTMTSCKLLLLKYPLRFGASSSGNANLFCSVSWLIALVFPMTILSVDSRDVYFSYRSYRCSFRFTSDIYHWLGPSLAVSFILIPNCLVLTTTIWVLIRAKRIADRGREHLKWQGITTIVLTAGIHCISFLPSFVYRVGESIVTADDMSRSFFHTTFYRIGHSLVYLNTISNFYIYCLTVNSFRDFIRSRLQLVYQFFHQH